MAHLPYYEKLLGYRGKRIEKKKKPFQFEIYTIPF
jgi:hypothetical protein